ncbi:MAG: protein-export chaperone SecB [Pseudomonadota bacterium]
MADETPATQGSNPTAQAQPRQTPNMRVLAQYIKDFSFENPGTARSQSQPNIDLGIDVNATPHKDGQNMYEVSLRMQAKATAGETTLFILELDYAGLFQLENIQPNELEPMLLIECPRIIFPFARRIISDITRDGGFPPLLVDPIDFVSLYRGQKARQAEAAGAGGPQST